jgi:hypothetical protein
MTGPCPVLISDSDHGLVLTDVCHRGMTRLSSVGSSPDEQVGYNRVDFYTESSQVLRTKYGHT